MDRAFENELMKLVSEMSENKAVVCVMHNLECAFKFADNFLVLDKGKQAFYGTKEELINSHLAEQLFNLKMHIADNNIIFLPD